MAKKKEIGLIRSSAAEYLTYVASTGDRENAFEVRYQDENIWLTQKMMGLLYDVETHTVNYHIKKIFSDSELEEKSVIRKFRITAEDGKNYTVNHYSLEMIIAVGFKVNSERAVQFRKWVNQIARDYTIKGWVMDDCEIIGLNRKNLTNTGVLRHSPISLTRKGWLKMCQIDLIRQRCN